MVLSNRNWNQFGKETISPLFKRCSVSTVACWPFQRSVLCFQEELTGGYAGLIRLIDVSRQCSSLNHLSVLITASLFRAFRLTSHSNFIFFIKFILYSQSLFYQSHRVFCCHFHTSIFFFLHLNKTEMTDQWIMKNTALCAQVCFSPKTLNIEPMCIASVIAYILCLGNVMPHLMD